VQLFGPVHAFVPKLERKEGVLDLSADCILASLGREFALIVGVPDMQSCAGTPGLLTAEPHAATAHRRKPNSNEPKTWSWASGGLAKSSFAKWKMFLLASDPFAVKRKVRTAIAEVSRTSQKSHLRF
jgi:hypothetical protein